MPQIPTAMLPKLGSLKDQKTEMTVEALARAFICWNAFLLHWRRIRFIVPAAIL